MEAHLSNRTRLIQGLYAANIVGAGVPGALTTFAPTLAESVLFWSPQDPTVLSILGSIWLAIGITSILGLRYPQRLLGVFVVQLIYKTIWLATFALPAIVRGTFRPEAWVMVGIFLALIIGVIAIVPLRTLLGETERKAVPQAPASSVRGTR
jgi:hypothetical protein